MEKVLILFSLANTLEQESVRRAFIRIPEVTVPLRSAQSFLDKFSSSQVDLLNYAGSDSEDFESQPQLKPLITSLIHWGLYQRLTSRMALSPQWLIGDARGSQGVMGLILGRLSFSEFLWQSSVVEGNSGGAPQSLPGKALAATEFKIYARSEEDETESYRELSDASLDRAKLVEKCVSVLGAKRVVTVGPSSDFSSELMRRRSLLEFDLMESTEIDPQLHWMNSAPRPLALV